ncbi:MAG: glycosyltransferase, partial [Arenicellales bacterium]
MTDSSTGGVALLVCQAGRSGHWVLDLASLRPYVAGVLSVQSGKGIDLLTELGETFPGVRVESLRFGSGSGADHNTRCLHEALDGLGDWVLLVRSGYSPLIGRRFEIPDHPRSYSALHLLPETGQARWVPVLVPNRPEYLRVSPAGEVIVDVDPRDAGQLRELVVDARGRPATPVKSIARDLDNALAETRRSESAEALFKVAECHYRLKRYAEAEFWYQRLAGLDARVDAGARWSAQYHRALCLKAMNRPWTAVETALSTAFDLDPDRVEPLYHIARHYLDVHSYAKAFELSAIGLEIDMPVTGEPFEYSIYQHELPLVYLSCAKRLGKHRECVRLANRILRRPGVPEPARADAVALRSSSLDNLQPLYPLRIHRKNPIVVVTAFRNAGEFLEVCVASLAAQDYGDCRFILIDDASTDGALEALTIEDRRFTIQSNTVRQGVLHNQLDAVEKHCSADDIVVYVDGDDRLADDSALSFVNDFFNSTRCWLMYGQY